MTAIINGERERSLPDRVGFDIPHTTFTLDNGLTVIVHTNHQAPIVAVNIWYRVGAKDEPQGKSGLAHLFEHLMFGGSKNLPGSYVEGMLKAGALDVNGSTNHDRTNYYQTVPTEALDFALFAESDRMGHFLETLDQDLLDRQRRVVINEKDEREGAPYGRMFGRQLRACYPAEHPYAHTVLGEIEHLHGVTLEDARAWFSTYYTPSNAVLTLAGDIDEDTARAKVAQFFGHIPAGVPLARPPIWTCPIAGQKREVLHDNVPQPCVSITWNIAQYGDADTTRLTLVSRYLGAGVSSALNQRLVRHEQSVSRVSVSMNAAQLNGQFTITAWARPGHTLEAIEHSILQELDNVRAHGIPEKELQRVKAIYRSGFVKGYDTATAVADLLSLNYGLTGDPAAFRTTLKIINEATVAATAQAVTTWLADDRYTLHVLPFTAKSLPVDNVARVVPTVPSPRGFDLPRLSRVRLDNGLQVVFAQSNRQPLALLSLLQPQGSAADPADSSGLTPLLYQILEESGGREESAQDYANALQALGAEIQFGTQLDSTRINLFALSENLPHALEKFAEKLVTPHFSEDDFERCRALQLNAVDSRLASPEGIIHHLLGLVLYPKGHPYAKPVYGGGSRETLSRLTCAQLRDTPLYTPAHATLLVVGDIDPSTLEPELNRLLGQCQGNQNAQPALMLNAPWRTRGSVFLVDRPGAAQTTLAAATLVPRLHGRSEAAFSLLQDMLSSGFSSRLNLRLREEKNWTYGVSALTSNTQHTRIHGITTTVQADRSLDAIREVLNVYRELLTSNPVSPAELETFKRSELLRLSGGTDGVRQLAAQIRYVLEQALPADYWRTYAEHIADLNADEINALVTELIQPEDLTWIVVGDTTVIGDELRNAGLGEVHLIDVQTL